MIMINISSGTAMAAPLIALYQNYEGLTKYLLAVNWINRTFTKAMPILLTIKGERNDSRSQ